jgi:hypothetical protein
LHDTPESSYGACIPAAAHKLSDKLLGDCTQFHRSPTTPM